MQTVAFLIFIINRESIGCQDKLKEDKLPEIVVRRNKNRIVNQSRICRTINKTDDVKFMLISIKKTSVVVFNTGC